MSQEKQVKHQGLNTPANGEGNLGRLPPQPPRTEAGPGRLRGGSAVDLPPPSSGQSSCLDSLHLNCSFLIPPSFISPPWTRARVCPCTDTRDATGELQKSSSDTDEKAETSPPPNQSDGTS